MLTLAAAALVCCATSPLLASGPPSVLEEAAQGEPETAAGEAGASIEYGRDGLDIRSSDGNFHAHVDWRAQLRYSHEAELAGESDSGSDEFEVKRARFKLGGHAYRPWLQYYLEYDFPSSRLLDMRLTLAAWRTLQLRAGQWKVPYNRERVDSSGKQQFVERSIVNDYFTLDRQQGLLLFGRLDAEGPADSWYNLGVFTGTGRGGDSDNGPPLLLARYQWNFLRRNLGYSQSDTGYRQRPAGSLALAWAHNRSAYTRFSSAGGGQLPGFEPGDPGRYELEQWLFESALQYRGFSLQQELHHKRVDDRQANSITKLRGGYLQLGLFAHTLWPALPRPLETAVRYAAVDPDREIAGDLQREWTLGCNWFFYGHRNKLSFDLTWLRDEATSEDWRWRLRAQWDVSF